MGVYNDSVSKPVFHVNEGKSELLKELSEEICSLRQR